jgi:hypothetical protein
MIGLRRYIALAGFLLGGIGAAVEQPALVWAAIGLLSAALLLRLLAASSERRAGPLSDTLSTSEDE